MPRVGLLIADDVGLGKTIEAGLVVQELLLRHRARRILIVTPADLQLQWRDEMRDKFGLEFRIVDTRARRQLRRARGIHANPWTHFPRLITSIDCLKRETAAAPVPRDAARHGDEPRYPRRYDLLIVDEAHNVAPSGRGRYATDSLRTEALREIVPHFEHRLFLTATPHNGYHESFTALLELLDDQRFARGVSTPTASSSREVMVRRLKSRAAADLDGTPRFPERKLEADRGRLHATTSAKRTPLSRATPSCARKRAAGDAPRRSRPSSCCKLLKKRLFSSPAAFARTLARRTGRRSRRAARRGSAHSRCRRAAAAGRPGRGAVRDRRRVRAGARTRRRPRAAVASIR